MDALIYVLFLVAIGLGYAAGRWPIKFGKQRNVKSFTGGSIEKRYIDGLNQLLNEQPDAAIDTFIEGLDVNDNTLETHFALGALWRRRGEVDRAIRIHQNLMARPSLSNEHLEQAQLELAVDYTRSGLLDRAESLFSELSKSSNLTLKSTALKYLLEVYEQEQEWNQAIETAEALCFKKLKTDVPHWRYLQAHYACESAQPLIDSGEIEKARTWLKLAQSYDRQHPRVQLLFAKLDLSEAKATNALRFLRHVSSREAYLIEVIPLIFKSYELLGEPDSAHEYFAEIYQENPLPGLLPYLAERIHLQDGSKAAVTFLLQELRGNPDKNDMVLLLDAQGPDAIDFEVVRPVLREILGFTFHCKNCGFEGTHLYWSCPSCKAWL